MHHSRSVAWLTCWAALVEELLDVTLSQGKSVVAPEGMLDDGHRETVVAGLDVGHGEPASPDPVKATQPMAAFAPIFTSVLGAVLGMLFAHLGWMTQEPSSTCIAQQACR